MIVDSSAILTVLLGEPEAAAFAELLARSDLRISAATYVEIVNVCDRRIGSDAVAKAEQLIERAQMEIVPFTVEQAHWARHARLTYGIGRHPAKLNFGDCFVYALAKTKGEPLLFKGDDFSQTDVIPAS